METTKKLNETPLIQEMTADHTYVIVDSQGNVSRMNDVPKKYVTETELTDFIKPYDERITTNQTDISNLETNIGSTKTDVLDLESYMDIVTPKSTAKGELVHITDALNLPTFETKSSGNVEQETTKGYNLIGLPDVEETTLNGLSLSIKDGLIILNGTATGMVPISNILVNIVPETSNYRLEIFPQSGTKSNAFIGVRGFIDGTQKWYIQTGRTTDYVYSELTSEQLTDCNRYDIYVTKDSIFDNFKCYVQLKKGGEYASYEPYTGGQASPNPEYPQEIEVLEGYNLFNSFIATKSKYQTSGELQIEKDGSFVVSGNTGSNNYFALTQTLGELCPDLKVGDTVYLQLETTSIVKNIYIGEVWANNYSKTITQAMLDKQVVIYGGYNQVDKLKLQVSKTPNKPYLPYSCVGYKVNGKNLLNVDAKKNTYNGMEFTPIYKDNGTLDYINVNGTATSDTYLRVHQIERYDIDKQKTYIINGSPSGGSTKTYGMVTYYYDENNTYINGVYEFGNGVQIPQSAKLNVNIFVKSGVTMNNAKFYPMLRLASDTDDDYEPYQEQIFPLDLKGNWVGAINDDIRDYLVTDKKKYWLVKNVGKYVFTGDENNLVLRATYNNICQFELRIFDGFYQQYNAINIISSHYKGIAFMSDTGNSWTIDNTITIIGDGNIVIMTSQFTTVEEFKAYLKEQYNNGTPVVAYYRPKTPQIIELGTLEEPIKTFEGVNNIQLLANLDTEIEVVYAQDVKKYIDSKLAEISAQII